MRINLTFYVHIDENSNIDELKELIIGTFKQDFEVIFKGKKIRPGHELSKINISNDSKLFLMFSKTKSRNADSMLSAQKLSENSIGQLESADSTNPGDFSKEKHTSTKVFPQAEDKNQKDLGKNNKKEESQPKNKAISGDNSAITLNATQLVNTMPYEVIMLIGKGPNFYDEFIKSISRKVPSLENFFTDNRSKIIKLCQRKAAQPYSNSEIKQIPDEKTILKYDRIKRLIRSAQEERALDLCNQGLKTNPNDGIFHELKVKILIELNRNDEAFDAFNEGIKVNSSPTNNHRWRCKILRDMGRKIDALVVINQAILVWPHSAELLVEKGKILNDLNEREESIQYFILAFEIDRLYAKINFVKTFPDANDIFFKQFPSFSIKKGLKCNICNLTFAGSDTQYLCLYCEPSHYHCDNCENIVKCNVEGSAKFAHQHSTFMIHQKARFLNNIKLGASIIKNIEYSSDQEDKKHKYFCDKYKHGFAFNCNSHALNFFKHSYINC